MLYTAEPEGFETGESNACLLNTALYGLVQSAYLWFEEMKGTMLAYGLTQAQLTDKEKQLQIREQQLGQERTRLEGLSTDQTNVLATRNAAQAQQIAALTQENDRLREEAAANVEQLRQLWEQEEEAKRVCAEMVTYMGNLGQHLAAQTQVTTRVQNQLVTELWTGQRPIF